MSGSDKLPPLPQEFYDEQRERFAAESYALDMKNIKGCNHFFIRKSFTDVQCKLCPAGWHDNNKFVIKDGKIVSIKSP